MIDLKPWQYDDGPPVSASKIREWNEILCTGGSIALTATTPPYKRAIILALVRRMNGCGPDLTSEYGQRAMSWVDLVLGPVSEPG